MGTASRLSRRARGYDPCRPSDADNRGAHTCPAASPTQVVSLPFLPLTSAVGRRVILHAVQCLSVLCRGELCRPRRRPRRLRSPSAGDRCPARPDVRRGWGRRHGLRRSLAAYLVVRTLYPCRCPCPARPLDRTSPRNAHSYLSLPSDWPTQYAHEIPQLATPRARTGRWSLRGTS
jgi:hypothetical protein